MKISILGKTKSFLWKKSKKKMGSLTINLTKSMLMYSLYQIFFTETYTLNLAPKHKPFKYDNLGTHKKDK